MRQKRTVRSSLLEPNAADHPLYWTNWPKNNERRHCCEYFEVLLPDGAQKHGLVDDIEVDSAGLVHAFDEPGLGAKIDFDRIEAKRTAVLC